MFVKNDLSRDKLFFNGKIGKVESFEDDIIVVKCPDDDFPIRVEMAEWQNMKYTLDEETKEIRGDSDRNIYPVSSQTGLGNNNS